MKIRHDIIVSILLALMLCLTGCGGEVDSTFNYDIYLCGTSDFPHKTDNLNIIHWADLCRDDTEPRQTIQVTINDKVVKAMYTRSSYSTGVSYREDHYYDKNNKIRIIVNARTGNIVSYSIFPKDRAQLDDKNEFELREIADAYVQEYVNPRECYVESPSTWDEAREHGFITFWYKRLIGDIETSSCISININLDGSIRSLDIKMVEEWNEVIDERGETTILETAKQLSSDRIKEEILSLNNGDNPNIISSEISTCYLTILPSGEFAMIYYAGSDYQVGNLFSGYMNVYAVIPAE